MKRIMLLALILGSSWVHAQSAYRWVDQEGKLHYSEALPPQGAREVEILRLEARAVAPELPYFLRLAVEKHPVTLHVTATCGAPCKTGRDYLNGRGIPFTEKPVVTDADLLALRQLIGIENVPVPLMQVGTKTAAGFLETEWSSLLDDAGYPPVTGR